MIPSVVYHPRFMETVWSSTAEPNPPTLVTQGNVKVPAEGVVTAVPIPHGLYCCSDVASAGQLMLGVVQNGCMVQALVVVTVQCVIVVRTKGENRGRIAFLMINSVFASYFAVSLPTVVLPKI